MKPDNTHLDRWAGAGTPRRDGHRAREFVRSCVAFSGSGDDPPFDLDPLLGLIRSSALATLGHAGLCP